MTYDEKQAKVSFSSNEHLPELEEQVLEEITGAGPVFSKPATYHPSEYSKLSTSQPALDKFANSTSGPRGLSGQTMNSIEAFNKEEIGKLPKIITHK